MQSSARTNSTDMILTLAWLLLALCGLLLAQTDQTQAASLESSQVSAQRGAPESVGPIAPDAANTQNDQRQIVRRRRSSDSWPIGATSHRHTSQRQQKLLGDAAFGQQLSELIAQARNDKALERALLKMLINATLRPSAASVAAANADSTNAAEPALGSIDQLLASAERAQRDEQSLDGGNNNNAYPAVRLITNLEQILNNSPGFVDQSSAVNSNDLGQLSADAAYGVDKREFKPCNFNAISCVKNPFRTSVSS